MDAVKEFVISILRRAETSYRNEVNPFSRGLHHLGKTTVYLAQGLFERLMNEMGVQGEVEKILINGTPVVRGPHTSNRMDCVVDMHSHFPMGYNPCAYGLR